MNRTFLFSGYGISMTHPPMPFSQLISLEPHEVLDVAKLHEVHSIFAKEVEAAWSGSLPRAWQLIITGFSQLENGKSPQLPPLTLHLNPADFAAMPPVDSPLLIEIQPGVLVKATRPVHAEQKDAKLRYDLEGGGYVVGRFPWTHQ